jgi:hypothetical protein
MRRAALMFAIAGLGSGCYSSSRSGDVTVYWEFSRNLEGGGSVGYDTNVSPGGGSASCPQSGADYVVVTFLDGSYVDPATPTLPCVYNGVQGATFLDFARGPTTFVVTGYRNGVSNPLYTGQGTVDVVGGANNPITIVASGIPDDLDLVAHFCNANGTCPLTFPTCSGVGVDTLSFHLVDWANTSVAVGTVSCGTGTPGVSFTGAQALDRDNYAIRMQSLTGGAAGTVLDDSATSAFSPVCSSPAFDHYGNDTGSFAWIVNLYDVSAIPPASRCP